MTTNAMINKTFLGFAPFDIKRKNRPDVRIKTITSGSEPLRLEPSPVFVGVSVAKGCSVEGVSALGSLICVFHP